MVVIGYVIIRLALVTQWLRVAAADPQRRVAALRFAIGITLAQAGWIARLWLPDGTASFLILVAAELAIPIWAEHAARTTWHRTHIAERYGLFTLIVLGEAILASTTAIQTAFDVDGLSRTLAFPAAAILVLLAPLTWQPMPILAAVLVVLVIVASPQWRARATARE